MKRKIYIDIVEHLKSLSYDPYLNTLIGKSQKAQKPMIEKLQTYMYNELKNKFPNILWEDEKKPLLNQRDSIDIFGDGNEFVVVIELDKFRADQISKKFVSRSALFLNKEMLYIAFCYGGTEKMNKVEAKKYFLYCEDISKKLETDFVGLIVE